MTARGFGEDYGEIAITGSGATIATWGEAGALRDPGGIGFNRSR